MAYRSVNYVSNGWSNYNIPGPMGNQFATPFGDPYRVQGTGGVLDVLGSIASGVGKVITPLLPIATPIAGVAVSSLLNKPSTRPAAQPTNPIDAAAMQTSQAQAAAANAKSDNTVYLVAGGAALLALFYFLSRRK
jgi:hypothetical protein